MKTEKSEKYSGAQPRTSSGLSLDVGSGGGIFRAEPRGEVCVDIDLPGKVPKNFVRADALHLPFRNDVFDAVYAFNVLEHVSSPVAAMAEMLRVGRFIRARQDSMLSLPMWATPEHLWLQLPGFRFSKFPRTTFGVQLSRLLKTIILHKRISRALQISHLWFRWNYYVVGKSK